MPSLRHRVPKRTIVMGELSEEEEEEEEEVIVKKPSKDAEVVCITLDDSDDHEDDDANTDDDDDDDTEDADSDATEVDRDGIVDDIEMRAEGEEGAFEEVPSDRQGIEASDHYFLSQKRRGYRTGGAKRPKVTDPNRFGALMEKFEFNEANFAKLVTEEHEQLTREACIDPCPKVLLQRVYVYLREEFNVILYGFGSKVKTLNYFAQEFLRPSHHHVVIHGYQHDINLKHILAILNRALGNTGSVISAEAELFAALREVFTVDEPLYLAIHSIDRLFRTVRTARGLLMRLVASLGPRVRVVASEDMARQGDQWTVRERVHWRLVWFELLTYAPYLVERRATYGSAMLSASLNTVTHAGKQLESMHQVYQALNSNARKIFLLLLQQFLRSKSKATGVRFEELYQMCREEFLASSDATLRQHLTEVKDHSVVKVRPGRDGAETIYLVADLEVARRFVAIKESEDED